VKKHITKRRHTDAVAPVRRSTVGVHPKATQVGEGGWKGETMEATNDY